MTAHALPDRLVESLNQLGFALVEGEAAYTFLRLGPAGVFRVLVSPTQRDWRVELAAEGPNQIGRLQGPSVPDGTTLLLSTAQLVEQLPRFLESTLPAWDTAQANDG